MREIKTCMHKHTYVDRRLAVLKNTRMAFETTKCLGCKRELERSYKYLPIVVGSEHKKYSEAS